MPSRRSTIPVAVEVGALLVPRGTARRSGLDVLHVRVQRELKRLIGILGVPGIIELDIKEAAGDTSGDGLRMWVHGRECRYPAEVMSRVRSTVGGRWLAPAGEDVSPVTAGGSVADIVAVVCREIIVRRPSVVLREPQAARYVAGTEAAGSDPAWLVGTLARVLNARIAIDDRDAIITALVEQREKLYRNAAEVLIERVRPRELTILIHREYLRALTTSPWASDEAVVDEVRRRVETDLGIAPPLVVFAEDRQLPEFGFAFVVGDLETLTWIGLPPDRCLVGDAVETLELLDIRGEPALHPVSDVECAVVPIDERDTASMFHIPTWGPDEYLGLCLEKTMRDYASCLIDAGSVRQRLNDLESIGAESVVLGRRVPLMRIVRLMRSLLAEQISVSDFPSLIEVLAEHDVELQAKPDNPIWSDRADAAQKTRDRDANTAARRRLSRQVAATVAHDGIARAVTAVVLDDRLHQAVSAAADQSELLSRDDDELLNASVGRFLDAWPGDRRPALLTNAKVRSVVQTALVAQFPDLPVIAYEELPFDVELAIADDRIVPVGG
jgi:hypothetical protein